MAGDLWRSGSAPGGSGQTWQVSFEPDLVPRRTLLLGGVGFVVVGVLLVLMGGWLYRAAGVLAVTLGLLGLVSLVFRRRAAPPAAPPLPPPPAAEPPAAWVPSARPLSGAEQQRVLGHVDALRDAGVLDTDEPDVSRLITRLEEEGAGADPDLALVLILEAQECRRLTVLESQVEQDADAVRGQVEELARICGTLVAVESLAVQRTQPREVRVRARLDVAGRPVTYDYLSPSKNLARHLPVGLAREIWAAGSVRMAGLESGDGDLFVAALPPDADLAHLNRDLIDGSTWRGPVDGWYWLDEADPG